MAQVKLLKISNGILTQLDSTNDELTMKSFSGIGSSLTALSASNINAGVLAETLGGTNQSTYTTGDILYASDTNTLSKLGVGTEGQVLKISTGIPAWGNESGGTQLTQTYTSGAGGIAQYDAVYVSANDTILKANAGAIATARVIGFASAAINESENGTIVTDGLVTGVGSGWTASLPVFLSTTSGLLTQTAPSGSGEVVVKLGYAKNATDLQISMGDPIQLA